MQQACTNRSKAAMQSQCSPKQSLVLGRQLHPGGQGGGVAEWETDSRQHILTLSFNAMILLSSRSKEEHCTIPVFPAEKVISLTNNNTAGCLQFFNCVSPMQKQAHKHWDKEGVRLCVLRVAACRLSQIFHYRYLRKPHACSSLCLLDLTKVNIAQK